MNLGGILPQLHDPDGHGVRFCTVQHHTDLPDGTVTAATCCSARRWPLPQARNVLVVTARPGQESAELGGVLYAFRRSGASLALLCLTRGEASPLNSTRCSRLEAIRPWELQVAAHVLGISSVTVVNYPDGALHRQPPDELAERVWRAIRAHSADLLLVPDPQADNSGDTAVAAATCAAATQMGVPALARTEPGAKDSWLLDLGTERGNARAIQKCAVAAHESQSQALPELARGLDLAGGREALRWLVRPGEHNTGKLPEEPAGHGSRRPCSWRAGSPRRR